MVEAGEAVGAEADAARARMIAAGYPVHDCPLKKVHCNEQPGCENLTWMENGFVQCFTQVDGRCARVMDYAPGQQLQPHKHDIDEQFYIGGGAVLVSKWTSSEPTGYCYHSPSLPLALTTTDTPLLLPFPLIASHCHYHFLSLPAISSHCLSLIVVIVVFLLCMCHGVGECVHTKQCLKVKPLTASIQFIPVWYQLE